MELLSSSLCLLFTLALIRVVFLFITPRKCKNLPPGPKPFPVIGNLLAMGDRPHESLAELAKTYGPIMSLKLGQVTTVVISSPAVAKEVHQNQDMAFCNRWLSNTADIQDHDKHSVLLLPIGDRWRILRKILASNMLSGSKLDSHKDVRRKKVEELVSYVGKCCKEGTAVDIRHAAYSTTINMLSNTLFSVDLIDLAGKSSAQGLNYLIQKIVAEFGKPNISDFFPFLAVFDPQGIRKRTTLYNGKLLDMVGKMVDERTDLRRRISLSPPPENDVMDVLLNISEVETEIDKKQIQHLCKEILIVGTDVTSSTIEWTMAELLRNPAALLKAKAELEKVVGSRNYVDEADLPRLPYLGVIVREVLRLHAPIPLLVPRTVATDVDLCGYTVPKGAQVILNAWAIARDPEVWSNPTCFMPERFLDCNIDLSGQDFELIPFGTGRRICPGLPMATRMVPVIVGSLINSFGWKLEGGIPLEELDMEDNFGFLLEKAQPLFVVPLHK